MIDFTQFDSLFSLVSYFNTEKKCIQALRAQRWGKEVACPICGSVHVYERKDGRFRCADCHHTFSVTSGTIFENTKLSLRKWFMAMYLISSHKKGISSHQLSRDLHVTQRTAWFMLQKIRLLYPQCDGTMFEGTVECDEVYIGGKEKWKHKSMRTPHTQGRSTKTKTPVFGMIERSTIINKKGEEESMSYVQAFVVEKTDKATLQPIIRNSVASGSRVVTDELNAYSGLKELGFTHEVVNHGSEEYAVGDVFTNTIEGFWSHFSRMISGCYLDVTDKYLQRYIDEAAYRWNTRKMDESERFAHMFSMAFGLIRKWDEVKDMQFAA